MTYSDQLRLIADFFEKRPDLPTPRISAFLTAYCDRETFLDVARTVGKATKTFDKSFANLNVKITDDVTVQFYTYRTEVCERRVVGTREVEAQYAPAYVEEIVEWDCHPILAEKEGNP